MVYFSLPTLNPCEGVPGSQGPRAAIDPTKAQVFLLHRGGKTLEHGHLAQISPWLVKSMASPLVN